MLKKIFGPSTRRAGIFQPGVCGRRLYADPFILCRKNTQRVFRDVSSMHQKTDTHFSKLRLQKNKHLVKHTHRLKVCTLSNSLAFDAVATAVVHWSWPVHTSCVS